jgi:AraC-like DNA-binding protein
MAVMHEKITKKPSISYNIVYSSFELGYPNHWHQEIEVIYVLEGMVNLILEGKEYFLKPGEIFLINSCELHMFLPNKVGNKKIILQFDKSAFDPYGEHVFRQRFSKPNITAVDEDQLYLHSILEKDITDIFTEWEKKLFGYEVMINARIGDLAANIIRYSPMAPIEEKSKRLEQIERLEEVFRYIEQYYKTNITLSMAAEKSGLSLFYFSRLFKEATGTKFTEYLNTFRINKAMKLLRSSDMKIDDIAFATGFNSVETFNRVFKQVCGCIPSEYRNKY